MKQSDTSPVVTPIMQNSDDPIFERVCTLLAPYNRNNISISRETVIVSDLEVDSVAVFDLIMEIEDSYDITFPMETVSEMKSVGDLIDTVRVLRQS